MRKCTPLKRIELLITFLHQREIAIDHVPSKVILISLERCDSSLTEIAIIRSILLMLIKAIVCKKKENSFLSKFAFEREKNHITTPKQLSHRILNDKRDDVTLFTKQFALKKYYPKSNFLPKIQ